MESEKVKQYKLIFEMNLRHRLKYPEEKTRKPIQKKYNDGLSNQQRYALRHPELIKELNKKYYSSEYQKKWKENNMTLCIFCGNKYEFGYMSQHRQTDLHKFNLFMLTSDNMCLPC